MISTFHKNFINFVYDPFSFFSLSFYFILFIFTFFLSDCFNKICNWFKFLLYIVCCSFVVILSKSSSSSSWIQQLPKKSSSLISEIDKLNIVYCFQKKNFVFKENLWMTKLIYIIILWRSLPIYYYLFNFQFSPFSTNILHWLL